MHEFEEKETRTRDCLQGQTGYPGMRNDPSFRHVPTDAEGRFSEKNSGSCTERLDEVSVPPVGMDSRGLSDLYFSVDVFHSARHRSRI